MKIQWKEFVSREMWRMRQSSQIVNLFFYALTLAGVYAPIVERFFPLHRGILLVILYIISFMGLVALGFVYDIVLQLWKEEKKIMVERDPYQIDLYTEKELQGLKVNLSNFKATYEAMRTNMLICEKLGIDASDLNDQLIDIKEKIDIFEEWVRAGKITRKIHD